MVESDYRFVLGSSSPRRKEILTKLGYKFEVEKPGFEEVPVPGLSPEKYVGHNAVEKAKWISENISLAEGKSVLILAADTIVVFDNQILEKPKGPGHSFEMLSKLSGNTHTVMTGYALYDWNKDTEAWKSMSAVEKTSVTFNQISEEQIREYIATGEPKDKAGSYGIQGMGNFLIQEISGSLSNVIGLPEDAVERSINTILKSF